MCECKIMWKVKVKRDCGGIYVESSKLKSYV